MKDFIRILAAWALVHESADEGWKAAVERGERLTPGALERGPDAFVDALAALVSAEKERLKHELAADASAEADGPPELGAQLDALRFEVAELRGAVESLQASIEAIASRNRG